MSPADRAALAARLRGMARSAGPRGWLVSDLLAAATELERPRPRVEWEPYPETSAIGATPEPLWRPVHAALGSVLGHGFGMTLAEISVERVRLLAAGFDVAPLPEVPRG